MENEKCKTKAGKLKILNFELWFLVFSFQLLVILCLCGCSAVEYLRPGNLSYDDAGLSATYDQTVINKSMTLDVLPRIQASKNELLSQSESVVASLGQDKNGYKTWFNMVAFHEYSLTAIRKYFFIVDEKVRARPGQSLRFDCQMALAKDLPGRDRAAENTRQIAILRRVIDNLRKDIGELGENIDAPGRVNGTLNICKMLIQQVLDTILLKLEDSPGLATKLSEPGGVDFDHLSFDRGKIRMVVENDIVTGKIRLGALARTFEQVKENPEQN